MQKEVHLIFHNRGLRSFIEIDLCLDCPRQDDKGCCGYYSPVFYPSDFAFLLRNKPDFIEYIFNLENITILDSSVTINNTVEGKSYRCKFHTKDSGCILTQELRESVCRHFVCPGVNWENDEKLSHWKDFFVRLSDYEIKLNNEIAAILKEKGLTLRDKNQRSLFFNELLSVFDEKTRNLPAFFTEYPPVEEAKLMCEIRYGEDWPL